jgi:hypothetical protein
MNNTNNVITVEKEKESNISFIFSRAYKVLHTLLALFSIYLSFRCNGGFAWRSVILSILFPYIYILYSLATYNGLCVNPNSTK